MAFSIRHTPLLAALLLAACQPTAVTPVTPSPSAGPPTSLPSAGPTTDLPASTAPVASPSTLPTVAARFSVVGTITNEGGRPIEDATIVVDSDDAAFKLSAAATGGAFGVREVPVGTRITVTATAPGYTARTRTLVVRDLPKFDASEGNRLDFGGTGSGYFSYLSKEPEISSISPANLASEIKTNPLEVVFTFSHAIRQEDQGHFENLVRVRIPSVGGAQLIQLGSAFGAERVRFSWNADSTIATMRFAAPIVTRQTDAAASIEFDPEVDLTDWPQDEGNRRLGFALLPTALDGAGTSVRNRIAPIARQNVTEPIPSTRPSPLDMWSKTHVTSSRFNLARDLSPLKVVSITALPGAGGEDDFFEVKFNKPVNGFPADAIAYETTSKSSYRFVLGRTSTKDEREAFEKADPAKSGNNPTTGIEFYNRDPYVVLLHDRSGRFSDNRRFKLFVDPRVEDVAGVALGGEGIVMEGTL